MAYLPWITALAGLLVGWWIRRELAMRERRETQAMWEQQLQRAESQRDLARAKTDAKDRRIVKLEGEIDQSGNELDHLRRKVAERDLELRDLTDASRHLQEAHRHASKRALELADKGEILEKERNRYKDQCVRLESENLLFREMVSTAEIALLERERTIEELETRPIGIPLSDSIRAGESRKKMSPAKIDPILELLNLEEELLPHPAPIAGLEPTELASPKAEKVGEDTDIPKYVEGEVIEGDTKPVALPEHEADDLTLIKGIGPAFARRLEAMGITRLAQIAEWSEQDLEQVASALEISPKRILNADWVQCARDLL